MPIFKYFSELGKIWLSSLGFSKISIHHFYESRKTWKYTQPNRHFEIRILHLWMKWERICPNFSFTVENEIGSLHKYGWSHFKLNTND